MTTQFKRLQYSEIPVSQVYAHGMEFKPTFLSALLLPREVLGKSELTLFDLSGKYRGLLITFLGQLFVIQKIIDRSHGVPSDREIEPLRERWVEDLFRSVRETRRRIEERRKTRQRRIEQLESRRRRGGVADEEEEDVEMEEHEDDQEENAPEDSAAEAEDAAAADEEVDDDVYERSDDECEGESSDAVPQQSSAAADDDDDDEQQERPEQDRDRELLGDMFGSGEDGGFDAVLRATEQQARGSSDAEEEDGDEQQQVEDVVEEDDDAEGESSSQASRPVAGARLQQRMDAEEREDNQALQELDQVEQMLNQLDQDDIFDNIARIRRRVQHSADMEQRRRELGISDSEQEELLEAQGDEQQRLMDEQQNNPISEEQESFTVFMHDDDEFIVLFIACFSDQLTPATIHNEFNDIYKALYQSHIEGGADGQQGGGGENGDDADPANDRFGDENQYVRRDSRSARRKEATIQKKKKQDELFRCIIHRDTMGLMRDFYINTFLSIADRRARVERGLGDTQGSVISTRHGADNLAMPTEIFTMKNLLLGLHALGVDRCQFFGFKPTAAGLREMQVMQEHLTQDSFEEFMLDKVRLVGRYYEVRPQDASPNKIRNAILPWVPKHVTQWLTLEKTLAREESMQNDLGNIELTVPNDMHQLVSQYSQHNDGSGLGGFGDDMPAILGGLSGQTSAEIIEAPRSPADLLELYEKRLLKQRNNRPRTRKEKMEALQRVYYCLHNRRLINFLPESEKNVMRWGMRNMNRADNSIMIAGKVDHADGYGPYSSYLSQLATFADKYKSINRNNLDMFCHIRALSTNKFDRRSTKKLHLICLGQGQAGKSHTMEAALLMGIPGTYTVVSALESRQAYSSGGELLSSMTIAYDELPPPFVDSERNLHGDDKAKVNEIKAITSMGKHVRMVMELIKDPITGKSERHTRTIITSLRMQYIGMTNSQKNKDEAMGTRFFTRVIAKDRGMSTIDNIAQSFDKAGFIESVSPYHTKMEQSIEYVAFIIHFAIGVGALEPPSGKITNLLLVDILTKMYEKKVKKAPDARNYVRIFQQANELCIQRNIIKSFFMESGKFYGDNFRFFKHLPELEIMLYHTPEDLCVAFAFLCEHYFDALRHPFVRHLINSHTGLTDEAIDSMRKFYHKQMGDMHQERIAAQRHGAKNTRSSAPSAPIQKLVEKREDGAIISQFIIMDRLLQHVLSDREGKTEFYTFEEGRNDRAGAGYGGNAHNAGLLNVMDGDDKQGGKFGKGRGGGQQQQQQWGRAAENVGKQFTAAFRQRQQQGSGGAADADDDEQGRVKNTADLGKIMTDLNYLSIQTDYNNRKDMIEAFRASMDSLPPDSAIHQTLHDMCTVYENIPVYFEPIKRSFFLHDIVPLYTKLQSESDYVSGLPPAGVGKGSEGGSINFSAAASRSSRRNEEDMEVDSEEEEEASITTPATPDSDEEDARSDAQKQLEWTRDFRKCSPTERKLRFEQMRPLRSRKNYSNMTQQQYDEAEMKRREKRIEYLMSVLAVRTDVNRPMCNIHRHYLTGKMALAISAQELFNDNTGLILQAMKETLEFAKLTTRKYTLPLYNKNYTQHDRDMRFTTLTLKPNKAIPFIELRNPMHIDHKVLKKVEMVTREMREMERNKKEDEARQLREQSQKRRRLQSRPLIDGIDGAELRAAPRFFRDTYYCDGVEQEARRVKLLPTSVEHIPLAKLRYMDGEDKITEKPGPENESGVEMWYYMKAQDLMLQNVRKATYRFDRDPEMHAFEERLILLGKDPEEYKFDDYKDHFRSATSATAEKSSQKKKKK